MRAASTLGAALSVVLTMACTSSAPVNESGPPDIRGTVTHVNVAGERIGTVRIEENPADQAGSAKASVRITASTTILRRAGDELARADFAAIEKGQRVEAWFTGPVMESYPVQATARRVVIE
jgi:hypothetical protein